MEYTQVSALYAYMKPYSVDFREKIVKAYAQGNPSVRKVAARFEVSKAFVQRMLKQQQ